MQWAKAKTILIWLFLTVDIILASVLMMNKISDGHDNGDKLVKILKSNNLFVRPELLKNKKSSVFAYEFTGLNITNEIVSEFIKDPVKIDNSTYESNDKTAALSFSSGNIHYENISPDFEDFKEVSEKNANSKIEPYLKLLGINKYVRLSSVFSKNNDIYVEYSYFFGNTELFSSKLTFVVNEKGIKKIDGNINIPNENSGYDFKLSGRETILMNFVQNNSFYQKETVVSITEGYYCISYDNLLVQQAIPVYRIKTTGKTYIYDAREGIDGAKRQLWSK